MTPAEKEKARKAVIGLVAVGGGTVVIGSLVLMVSVNPFPGPEDPVILAGSVTMGAILLATAGTLALALALWDAIILDDPGPGHDDPPPGIGSDLLERGGSETGRPLKFDNDGDQLRALLREASLRNNNPAVDNSSTARYWPSIVDPSGSVGNHRAIAYADLVVRSTRRFYSAFVSRAVGQGAGNVRDANHNAQIAHAEIRIIVGALLGMAAHLDDLVTELRLSGQAFVCDGDHIDRLAASLSTDGTLGLPPQLASCLIALGLTETERASVAYELGAAIPRVGVAKRLPTTFLVESGALAARVMAERLLKDAPMWIRRAG